MAANSNVSVDTSGAAVFEEDAVVYVYDRRKGGDPEKKIKLGALFTFEAFQQRIREVNGLKKHGAEFGSFSSSTSFLLILICIMIFTPKQ